MARRFRLTTPLFSLNMDPFHVGGPHEKSLELSMLSQITTNIALFILTFLSLVLAVTTTRLARSNRQLRRDIKETERRSQTDPLTGVRNRAWWDMYFHRIIDRMNRNGGELGVVMCDLNGFKAVNDEHGHAAGDAALRWFAELLLGCLRPEDIVVRNGGDEFCILLIGASKRQTKTVCQRLEEAARNVPFFWNKKRLPLSASFGGYSAGEYRSAHGRTATVDGGELVVHADTRLRRAKDGKTTGAPTAVADSLRRTAPGHRPVPVPVDDPTRAADDSMDASLRDDRQDTDDPVFSGPPIAEA